ncbi:uridine kinase [Ureaplasma canigenitalium]|uniref:uridine kinase n=1 Tax=Ureaplasma canigenitalium TaxID=42092 RepID=UPI00068F5F7B|nr:uridine kinase [Ureaplasma canigenitalium]
MKTKNSKKPFVIFIAGASGSGKSTFANALVRAFQNEHLSTSLLCMDSYYQSDKNLIPKVEDLHNYDDPTSLNWEWIKHDLETLIRNEPIIPPVYDYTISKHVKSDVVLYPSDVIIFEGIYAIYDEEINKLANLKVYVQTPKDECLNRRFIRDTRERGRTIESIVRQWRLCVSPMFDKYIDPSKVNADLIVPWSEKHEKTDFLIKSLIMFLINHEKK